jgi:L-asparagine transporter-like permease
MNAKPALDRDKPPPVAREQGLARELSTGQQAMMAIGGAIGTGLFLGSGLAVGAAGPSVILSYIGGAVLALLIGVALIEMCVAHPTAGSFGVYAGMYVSPFAGYAVRVSYWLMQVIATGGHLVAVSIYMKFWLPGVPGAVWIAAFSAALVYLNTRTVRAFGSIEYWFAMIKVVAITIFIVLAAALLGGVAGGPSPSVRNYLDHGGFFPYGIGGVWFGICFAIYSFIGVEIVGVTSGEARDPARTIPAAFRRLVLLLSLIYLVTMALLMGVLPWTEIGVRESPFVTVLGRTGVPLAASLMNFVVVSAALSSANANLYLISRTAFSLARAGFIPARFGAVSAHGTPLNALFASCGGLVVAILVRAMWPESAYVWFFGVSLFGALFVWLMIFVTHLSFRRSQWVGGRTDPTRRAYGGATSTLGAATIAAILVSTWWVPGLRVTILAGIPWLVLLAVGYWFMRAPHDPPAIQPH